MSKAGRKKKLRDAGGSRAIKGGQTRGQQKGASSLHTG